MYKWLAQWNQCDYQARKNACEQVTIGELAIWTKKENRKFGWKSNGTGSSFQWKVPNRNGNTQTILNSLISSPQQFCMRIAQACCCCNALRSSTVEFGRAANSCRLNAWSGTTVNFRDPPLLPWWRLTTAVLSSLHAYCLSGRGLFP